MVRPHIRTQASKYSHGKHLFYRANKQASSETTLLRLCSFARVQRLGVRPKEEGRTFVRYCISREAFQALKAGAPGRMGTPVGPWSAPSRPTPPLR